MMKIVKFYYCNREYYFNDILVFTGTSDFDLRHDIDKRNKLFIKILRDPNSYSLEEYRKLSDEELIKGMVIKELPKPTSFPKFNNEQPFQIKFNEKIIKNPTIISIRWTGYIWEYRIKNIGHEYDYQPENMLENI
jgi:hypothetical protein